MGLAAQAIIQQIGAITPPVLRQLQDVNGNIFDLSVASSIQFNVWASGAATNPDGSIASPLISNPATSPHPHTGLAQYQWIRGDTGASAGADLSASCFFYESQFLVEAATGPQQFPTSGLLPLLLVQNIPALV